MAQRLSSIDKMKSLLTVTSSAATVFTGFCIYTKNEKFYDEVVMPMARLLNPEAAHSLAVKSLKWGVIRKQDIEDPPILKTSVWGMQFKNPVGMAAGFDKQGEAVEGLHNLGFSFVEIGSVTPKPQPGNPKPRVFRLFEDKAVVNRYGFNSEGHDAIYERLKALKDNNKSSGYIGVNLGKNKDSEDAVQDYVDGIIKFNDVTDYFVINVSSPNTPGLRNLQNKKDLSELLTKVNEIRKTIKSEKPLLLKLAPDLSESERQDVADVVLNMKSRVDGLILCNTTISRPSLTNKNQIETGGLSGAPLNNMSTAIIEDMFKRTRGSIPIIGVGGIFSGEDAFAKIKAGASLLQIYTSYVYHGPPIVAKLKKELEEILTKNGYASITEAVGKGVNTRQIN